MIIFNALWEKVLEVCTVWLPCWCFGHKIWLVYCEVASDLPSPKSHSTLEMALKPSHLCIYIATTPMENPLPIQALESKN